MDSLRSCRVLAHTVISLVMADIDTPTITVRRKQRPQQEILFENLVIAQSPHSALGEEFQDSPEVFANAVGRLIRGIEDGLAVTHG
jgi:hypothetical protein